MPDRRLVITDADPASTTYGELLALAPGNATSVPIPAFQIGTATPTVGNTVGEGYYNSTTKTGYVWDGASWRSIVKDPMLSFATDADLLSNTSAAVGSYAVSQSTGNLFVRKPTGWSYLGIAEYATVADLLADSPSRGTLATAVSDGSTWERTATGWRCLVIRQLANTAAVQAWAGAGANIGDMAVADDVDVLYTRTATGWQPRTLWADTEANIRAATWPMNGQEAFATDTGRAFDRVAGAWVEEPIAHFATEALLLAATPNNGMLAWADDTNVVFLRAGGNWKRLQGPQISVGATAPTLHAAGDLWYESTKEQLQVADGTGFKRLSVDKHHFSGEVTLGAGATTGSIIKIIKNIYHSSSPLFISIKDGDDTSSSTYELHFIATNGSTGSFREINTRLHGNRVAEFYIDWNGTDFFHLNAKFSADAAGRVWKIGVTSQLSDISGVVLDGSAVGAATTTKVVPGSQLLPIGDAKGQTIEWSGSEWVTKAGASPVTTPSAGDLMNGVTGRILVWEGFFTCPDTSSTPMLGIKKTPGASAAITVSDFDGMLYERYEIGGWNNMQSGVRQGADMLAQDGFIKLLHKAAKQGMRHYLKVSVNLMRGPDHNAIITWELGGQWQADDKQYSGKGWLIFKDGVTFDNFYLSGFSGHMPAYTGHAYLI